MNKKLVIGRIVHYIAYSTPKGEFPVGAHRVAIITEVPEVAIMQQFPEVSLCVINPTGLFFNTRIPYDPTMKEPGSWHWPEG